MPKRSFKEAVLDRAVQPDMLGKFFIVACLFVFAAGVMITSNEREHAEIRELQAKNAQQSASNLAQIYMVGQKVDRITTEFEVEREHTSELRQRATDERTRILDILLNATNQ